MGGKYLLTTLGCKVNQYESQHIREILESHGFHPARRGEVADVAVVNTCAVTAAASRKNRQTIRKVAQGGRIPVIVIGCGATADGDRLGRIPGVSAVVGHGVDLDTTIHSLLGDRVAPSFGRQAGAEHIHAGQQRRLNATGNDLWMKAHAAKRNVAPAPGISLTKNSSAHLPLVKAGGALTTRIESFAGHQRAFLKVQDGCDAYCTYCIIPRLRSQLASKPIDVAVAEAQGLVCAGHKEIILTGIFLGAYGRETALRKRWGGGRSPLAKLVDALAGVEGLARLRLSSLEPGDVDESLLEVLATRGACVPHLHLPLQSGSEDVLRRMNRQYTTEAFIDMIQRVEASLDRPAISTDIIVGFPGETERDFEASLDIARYVGFCKIHAFPFSPREQTAAARWQSDFVPSAVVRERMRRLAEVEQECSLAFRQRFVGETERVIVERSDDDTGSSMSRHGIFHGRADRYFEIHFEANGPGSESHGTHGGPYRSDGPNNGPPKARGVVRQPHVRPGDLVTVRVDRVTPARTHGTLIRERVDAYPLCVLPAGAFDWLLSATS